MTVLFLVPRAGDAGTIAVLRALLREAIAGKVVGLALCYRARNGADEAIYTGTYKDRPADAVMAAMKISWRLTQLADSPP